MKKIILIFLSALSLTALAQQKIALLEPRVGDGSTTVSGMEKRMILGELRNAIVRFPGYDAFTRVDIDQILQEQNFQRTGMVSEDQIKKLGEMSGADYICVSTLTKSNEEFYLEAYLIHLESGRMLSPASQYGELTGGKLANMFPACQALAKDLIAQAKLVSTSAPQNTSSPRNDSQKQNTDELQENEHNFGIITEDGGRVSYTFKLPVGVEKIINVRASCACITHTWQPDPKNSYITLLTVTYNPIGRPGRFQKTITITREDGFIWKVYVKGEVIPRAQ